MNNEPEPISDTTSQLLQKLETQISSEPTPQEEKPPESLLPEKPARRMPLETAWQRKWLDLEVTHPDVQALANCVARFCQEWFHEKPSKRLLVIVGATGCGKTHVARRAWGWANSVAFERWRHHGCKGDSLPTVMFVEWNKIAASERVPEERFDDWIREASAESMLVIDDIGAESDRFKSGEPTSRLCELLNSRAGKFTLITTNVPPTAWAGRWDARVEDRLFRDSIVLDMTAPSFAVAQP